MNSLFCDILLRISVNQNLNVSGVWGLLLCYALIEPHTIHSIESFDLYITVSVS